MPNSSCFWCDQRFLSGRQRTRDHVRPAALGGTLDFRNIVLACGRCNRDRGRVVSHYGDQFVLIHLLRSATPERAERLLRRYQRRADRARTLQGHWRQVEESKLGHSPTGEIVILTAGQLIDAARELARFADDCDKAAAVVRAGMQE